jgi:hypothetical protein
MSSRTSGSHSSPISTSQALLEGCLIQLAIGACAALLFALAWISLAGD